MTSFVPFLILLLVLAFIIGFIWNWQLLKKEHEHLQLADLFFNPSFSKMRRLRHHILFVGALLLLPYFGFYIWGRSDANFLVLIATILYYYYIYKYLHQKWYQENNIE